MGIDELTKYKALLEARAAELAQRLRSRADILIESAPDMMDGVTLATQREAAVRTLDQTSRILGEIRKALARIESSEFGECQHCERAISRKRLDALPWAPFCIRCQEEFDARAAAESYSMAERVA